MLLEVATAPSVDGRRAIVRVGGQVDLSSAPDLRDALSGVATPGCAVVVDLAHVTFFSAAGLHCFEQFDDVVTGMAGRFALVLAGRLHPVSVVLRAVRMVDRWPIHPSVDAALAGFAGVRGVG